MEILGIGPLELIFILIIALLLIGPKDMEKTGKTIGQTLLKIVRSDTWKTVTMASKKIKTLPNQMIREVGLEELKKEIGPVSDELQKLNQVGRTLTNSQVNESWLFEPKKAEIESPLLDKAGETPAHAEIPGEPTN